jgi:molybdopterin-guanine dinucleotide biosynthesis protein A
MKKLFGTAAVLAGGKSSRMGFDKQLLMADNRRLIERTVETLGNIFEDILLVTNTPALYERLPVRVCSDVYAGMGPLGGIHAALVNTRSRYTYILACDMPFVCTPYIRYMQTKLLEVRAKACVAMRNDRIEPFNAFYAIDSLQDLDNRLRNKQTSLYYFLKENDACIISEQEAKEFDFGLQMYFNLNTQEEYKSFLFREQCV